MDKQSQKERIREVENQISDLNYKLGLIYDPNSSEYTMDNYEDIRSQLDRLEEIKEEIKNNSISKTYEKEKEEVQKARGELEERLAVDDEDTIDEVIDNQEDSVLQYDKPKTKEEKIEEILLDENADMNYFNSPILILTEQLEELTQKTTGKMAILTYILLSKFCDSNGVVRGVKIEEMAEYLNYNCSNCKNDKSIRNGLQNLEDLGFIHILKDEDNQNYNQYKIIDYNFEKGVRGTIVPEEYIEDKGHKFKFQELKTDLYYMIRNHHSPKNKNVMSLNISTLKKFSKANSYGKVLDMLRNSSLIENFKVIKNQIAKGKSKLKITIDNIKLKIFDTTDAMRSSILSHPYFKKIKSIFKNLGISCKISNFSRAFKLIDKHSEYALDLIYRYSGLEKYHSEYDTVGYLEFLFEQVKIGAII